VPSRATALIVEGIDSDSVAGTGRAADDVQCRADNEREEERSLAAATQVGGGARLSVATGHRLNGMPEGTFARG